MIEMSNIEHELKQCSKCSLVLLVKHFSVNKKGHIYKCCDNCRNNVSPDRDEELPAKLKDDFVNQIIQPGKGKIKYIGEVFFEHVPKETIHMLKPHLKGTEKFVEYHEFELIDSNTKIIVQYRVV